MKAEKTANRALFALSFAAVGFVTGCGEENADRRPLRGELSVYVADNFDGSSKMAFLLRDVSGVEIPLLVEREVDLIPGTEVDVWGERTSKGIVVDAIEPVSPPGEALISAPAYGTRNLAFVMVDIGGGVNRTPQQALDRLVNAPDSLKNFLLYESYGRQNITAQVFGPMPFTMSGCDTSALANALRPQIDSQGTFQHYLWYLGSQTSACGWSGLASVGTPSSPQRNSWYNASTSCVVLAQELSHNFGLQHSSSLRCPGTAFADDPNTCTASEYGDVFDKMGGGCRHTNAWQKTYQEWFGGCNGVSVTANGTFTLLPYEQRCDGAQFLKIKAPKPRPFNRPAAGGGSATTENLDYYYVELRTPRDFDGTLVTPRVLVHVATDLRGRSQRGVHTFLLDMTPSTTTFNDAALAQDQTFTDPTGMLSITARSVSTTQATIIVSSPTGTGAPTCLDGTTFAMPGPGPAACVENTVP